jgi:hypothetical protein
MTLNLHHPSLGEVLGIRKDSVAQFLGIKYATLEDRFAKSKLSIYRGNNTIDATKLG